MSQDSGSEGSIVECLESCNQTVPRTLARIGSFQLVIRKVDLGKYSLLNSLQAQFFFNVYGNEAY